MRVILVTGASSGIGRTAVIHLARAYPDAMFVLTARRADALRETARLAELPAARFDAVAIDLGEGDAPRRLADHVRVKHGRLDVLVNNAGMGSPVAFEHPDAPDATDQLLALNVRVPIQLVHGLLDLLTASRGSIVNISSVAGLVGQPNSPVYAASKWALTGFSDSIRARFASRGVHVACVHPGPVPTPGWPHERLTKNRLLRPLYCNVDTIGRAIVVAALQRTDAPVRPHIYHAVPLIRTLLPRTTRRLLARSSRMLTPG